MSLSIAGATFRVIGTDGGLLRAPYGTTRLTLPVGQRYDVEVTFDRVGEVALNSHVLVQDASGNVVEQTLPQLVVTVDAAEDDYPVVSDWTLPPDAQRAVDREVTLTFDAVNDPVMGLMWRINGVSHPVDPLFTFQRGETVRLVLVNRVGPEHPFHLHGQFFEVEEAGQPGLKDTVLVPGLSTVRVVARFDNPGRWMAHCHILEHAELGMMSEVVVGP
jgi:FtsP/CotA-like multicopper oxidase with cupredoxin domain